MDWEVIKKFMDKYDCSHETATLYFSLRDDGCTVEQALLWCGLADIKGER